MLFILWVFTFEGPSPGNIVKISNRQYLDTSAADGNYGKSYRASWTEGSFAAFELDKIKYKVEKGQDPNGSHVTSVGGLKVVRTSIEVVNAHPAQDNERELDYLFDGTYVLRGTVTGKLLVSNDKNPPIGDFFQFFTGVISRKPVRNQETIVFHIESTMGQTDGSLLTERFNGMEGNLTISDEIPAAPNSPVFTDGDFTFQIYASYTFGEGRIFHVVDNGVIIFEVYFDDVDDKFKMAINGRNKIVEILGLGGPPNTGYLFFTITIDKSEQLMDIWVDEVKVAEDISLFEDINTVIPTGYGVFLSDVNFGTIRMAGLRIWDRVLSGVEVIDRLKHVDPEDEIGLAVDWEFNSGRNATVFDVSRNNHHIAIPVGVSTWGASQNHGDRHLVDVIRPLVVGTAWSVPLIIYDHERFDGFVSIDGHSVESVISQGVPLVQVSEPASNTYVFDHLTKIVRYSSGGVENIGSKFVANQKIRILNSASGDFDGIFTISELVPQRVNPLRPQGEFYHFEMHLSDADWIVSSTETAFIETIDAQHNWRPSVSTAPRTVSLFLESAEPLFVNAIGDENILSTGAPGVGFDPPDYLDNVLAQLLKTYGPKWDNTTFPLPVYQSIDHRVGYYINDSTSTGKVVNELAEGCLVWVTEDGDGVIGLTEFQFPEELSSPQTILESEVLDVTRPHFNTHGIFELDRINVLYGKSWTVMDKNSIPPAVDANVKAFLTKEFRTVSVGDIEQSDTVTPSFTTYENRRNSARDIGKSVLRLSNGQVSLITFRLGAMDQIGAFEKGTLVDGLLPKYDLDNLLGVSLGAIERPTSERITVAVWSE